MTKLEPYNKNLPLTYKQYLRGNLYTLPVNAFIVASATKTITDKLGHSEEIIYKPVYGLKRRRFL